MSEIKYTIKSVLGGQSPLYHGAGKGQFLTSVAIDPEDSVSSKSSGYAVPIGYTDFTSSVPSGAPMWIITNPQNTNHYVYADDGEFYRYDSSLANETSIGTPTSGAGNGAIYYNDYIYLWTPTELSRYGTLSGGSPSLANTYWNGTLGLTLLTNTTYPGTNSVTYPNHAPHLHSDGSVYFCDYAGGQGLIHKLRTTSGGTNDGSAYNVLDLPFGVLPFDIESFGTDLAIIGSVIGSSTTVRQGQSFIFLWDTFSDSFYRQVPIPAGAFVSAIQNARGALYIWGGSVDRACVLFKYTGGYEVELVWEAQDGDPPFAGAVDAFGDRVVWGTNISTPITGGVIMSLGYQNKALGLDAVHNIGIMDSTQTLPTVSSLKFVQQAQSTKRPIAGWRAQSNEFGISKVNSGATKNAVLRSEVFAVDRPFRIKEIRVPLTGPVTSATTITPKIYFDDEGSNKTLGVINNTNYSGKSIITYKALEIENAATAGYVGKNNFFLEFAMTGTDSVGIALPVEIIVETRDN